ncbi:MlaD family protein [Nocardia nepalensis]|uniref:MlaD family protein n=1 Tax=Nocardia nepalensis TaxID=3375448 RepID=UPI003B66DB9C
MSLRTIASAASLIAIVAASTIYISNLGVALGPPEHRITLVMTVGETNGLAVGSNVLLRGIPIGKVSALEPRVDGAVVTFYYDAAHHIPEDTQIQLDNMSALGETYIEMTPNVVDGPKLRDGQHLSTRQVIQQPTVSDLAASLVGLLQQVGPDEVARIVNETDTALPAQEDVLARLSRAGDLLSATVDGRPGQGREILANLQDLLKNAGFVGPALAATGPELPPVGAGWQSAIAGSFDLVEKTGAPQSISDFGAFLERILHFLDKSAPDLKVLAETLLPNVTSIGTAARHIDTGAMLGSALAAVPREGALTLHIDSGP